MSHEAFFYINISCLALEKIVSTGLGRHDLASESVVSVLVKVIIVSHICIAMCEATYGSNLS